MPCGARWVGGFLGGWGCGVFPGIAQNGADGNMIVIHMKLWGTFFLKLEGPPECYSCYSRSCGKSTVSGGYGMIQKTWDFSYMSFNLPGRRFVKHGWVALPTGYGHVYGYDPWNWEDDNPHSSGTWALLE